MNKSILVIIAFVAIMAGCKKNNDQASATLKSNWTVEGKGFTGAVTAWSVADDALVASASESNSKNGIVVYFDTKPTMRGVYNVGDALTDDADYGVVIIGLVVDGVAYYSYGNNIVTVSVQNGKINVVLKDVVFYDGLSKKIKVAATIVEQ